MITVTGAGMMNPFGAYVFSKRTGSTKTGTISQVVKGIGKVESEIEDLTVAKISPKITGSKFNMN